MQTMFVRIAGHPCDKVLINKVDFDPEVMELWDEYQAAKLAPEEAPDEAGIELPKARPRK